MKTITVHSDGFGGKNTVLVTEDGELVDNVIEADIHLEAGRVTEMTLVMQPVSTVIKGAVSEVSFLCPLCQESHEHQCDSQAPISINVWDFQICGKIDGNKVCYINRDIHHSVHQDVRQGVSWG